MSSPAETGDWFHSAHGIAKTGARLLIKAETASDAEAALRHIVGETGSLFSVLTEREIRQLAAITAKILATSLNQR